MHSNTFGRLFSFASFGESHGPAIGCLVDGCPPRVPLSESDIQPFLDRRRPGRSPYVSPRREPDRAKILSGVYDGMTTGHPILIIIENRDQRSTDYLPLYDVFRPGHADSTYWVKYGIHDPRGGGRSSARETAARVMAGAVARKVLAAFPETAAVKAAAGLIRLGGVRADVGKWDDAAIDANPFFCPDPGAASAMAEAMDRAIAAGNSLGGVVEIRVRNLPHGLGEPVYDKLDARIAGACMGLNAVKGVEIGDGFAAAAADGASNNDQMRAPASGEFADAFLSNHAGGVLGGISTGADLIVRCALKPTPSIAMSQSTVDKSLRNVDLTVPGRHDPAVAIRAVPVLESMILAIIADFLLIKRAGERR